MMYSNAFGCDFEASAGVSAHCDAVLRDGVPIQVTQAQRAAATGASERDARESDVGTTRAYYSQWVRR